MLRLTLGMFLDFFESLSHSIGGMFVDPENSIPGCQAPRILVTASSVVSCRSLFQVNLPNRSTASL